MKKNISKTQKTKNDAMRSEYDFTKGVRGKHYKAYRKGHTVKIHKANNTTVVQNFKLEEGTVMLEPDVREFFSDSEAVNLALRSLIRLIPQKRRLLAKVKRV
jgi:hypothetical protein